MVSKRFDLSIIFRALLLCFSVFLFFYLITYTHLIATTFILIVLIVFQIFSFIHFVKKTNREVARFFDSIRYSDFSQSFKSGVKGSSFDELSQAFTGVIEEFKKGTHGKGRKLPLPSNNYPAHQYRLDIV